jgi:hypothetical protein
LPISSSSRTLSSIRRCSSDHPITGDDGDGGVGDGVRVAVNVTRWVALRTLASSCRSSSDQPTDGDGRLPTLVDVACAREKATSLTITGYQ